MSDRDAVRALGSRQRRLAASAIQAGVQGAKLGQALKAGLIGAAVGAAGGAIGAAVLYTVTPALTAAVAGASGVGPGTAQSIVSGTLFAGNLAQASIGLTQGDYTGIIGLGVTIGIGLAWQSATSAQGGSGIESPGTIRSEADVGAVAKDATDLHNPASVANSQEYVGAVYELPDGQLHSTPAFPGEPCSGGDCYSAEPQLAIDAIPEGARFRALWHTHGAPGNPGFEKFGRGDLIMNYQYSMGYADQYFGGIYLGTPSGQFRFLQASTIPGPFPRTQEAQWLGTIRTH